MCDVKNMTTKELNKLKYAIKKELKLRNKKEPRLKLRNYTLYVLMLERNKYYVGITAQRVDKRFAQHLDGTGAKWTQKHKPIGILESKKLGYMSESEATVFENKRTRDLMDEHGVSNVRGGDMCYTDERAILKKYQQIQEKAQAERDKTIYNEVLVHLS